MVRRVSSAAVLLIVLLAVPHLQAATTAPPDTVITLEHTPCFGACPIYKFTIDARGTVTYDGEDYVRVKGQQRTQIRPAAVAALLERASRIGFFDLQDRYYRDVTDLPTTWVTITANGRTKRIMDYLGAPAALRDLEAEIERVARVIQWVFIDVPTLETLLRSGWSARSDEGAALLQQASLRDDLPVASRLVKAGADPGGPPADRISPLFDVRSAAMAKLLIKAGVDPNQTLGPDTISEGPPPVIVERQETALIHVAGDPWRTPVLEVLVKAGADVHHADDGKTALYQAACGGVWQQVEILLHAGADPAGSTTEPAIDCARRMRLQRRQFFLDEPPVLRTADFDRVIALLERAFARRR